MVTENSITIDAPVARVFELAARIEDWPALLPHYRSVRVFRRHNGWKLAEMVATRSRLPARWVSIQELDVEDHVIRYRHVRGITRGMRVAWTMEPSPGGLLVRIRHEFDPPWPQWVGPFVARHVVGNLFVRNIAGRTLRHIKSLAESTAAAACPPRGYDASQ